MMDRQIGHMVRLIDDLLDVSRVTRGKISLQREPTALSSLVTNAVDASRAAIAAKRITLNVELPDSTCVVDVDPTRFLQVISNLLDNATKFTDSGGTISIRGHVNGKDRSEGPTQLSNADATVRRQWVDGRPLNAKAVTIPVATRSKGVRSRGTETIAAGCPV